MSSINLGCQSSLKVEDKFPAWLWGNPLIMLAMELGEDAVLLLKVRSVPQTAGGNICCDYSDFSFTFTP
jgi:hypothetical protein